MMPMQRTLVAAPLVLLAQLFVAAQGSSPRSSEMMRSRARISRRGHGGEHGEEPAQALVRDVAGARHRELNPVTRPRPAATSQVQVRLPIIG